MSYAAFLAAIRDEPESDVPRLICADWLEDNGDADRAELIRVQVELSKGGLDRPRSLELLRRLRELIVRHRPRWLGALAGHDPDAVFERGFIEQASLTAVAFRKDGRAIFAEHPIHRLRLYAISRPVTVAGCEHLAGVTALDLRELALGNRGLAVLGGSPYLGRLRALDLTTNSAGPDGVRRLVIGGRLRALERLNLRNNPVGPAGVGALASTPHLPALRELTLNSAGIDDAGATALAASPHLGALKTLRISYNPLTEAGLTALLGSPNLAGLEKVESYGAEIDTEARGRLRARYPGRLEC